MWTRWSWECVKMMTYEQLEHMAKDVGFEAMAPLDPGTIVLHREVRDMCAGNACGQYARRWSCPPGCGSLEACARRISGCSKGILVQTIGQVEDSFDAEGMLEAEATHKQRVQAMHDQLQNIVPGTLALGAGCCTRCETCSYPDAPCRFPEKMVVSMEAYGILVLEVCKANGLPYYYGPERIAYTSCFLLE